MQQLLIKFRAVFLASVCNISIHYPFLVAAAPSAAAAAQLKLA
jgi:hypothetical protein